MLLIFIVGPGGSHPLEGGWQAWLRTLCPSEAVSSSHSPPSHHLGQGPRGLWDVAEQGGRRGMEELVPRGPAWCQGIPTPTSRDLSPERAA